MAQYKGEDRISALPNTLLSAILFFLRTDEAVRTSLLSKRWKHVWTEVLKFDLGHLALPKSPSLISFVYKAIMKHPPLKIFHFCISDTIEEFHFLSWIWNLMRHIDFEVRLYSVIRETKLVKGLFIGENLRELSLDGHFDLSISTLYFKFPNLGMLTLSRVTFKDSLLDFSSSCPRLLALKLYQIYSSVKNLSIRSSTLMVLQIHSKLPHESNIQHLAIQAPNLECLYLKNKDVPSYDLTDIDSLVEAKIVIDRENCGTYEHILQKISCLRILCLAAFCFYPEDVYLSQLPVFHNLTCLELEDGTLSFILQILNQSPNLETLIMRNWGILKPKHEFWEHQSHSTPKCLLNSLKAIHLYGFLGWREQMSLAEYFLSTAVTLRVMKIHISSGAADTRTLQRLLEVPRVSSKCEVHICSPGKIYSSIHSENPMYYLRKCVSFIRNSY